MRSDEIIRLINAADDRFIQEAEESFAQENMPMPKRFGSRSNAVCLRFAAIAACAALAITALIVWRNLSKEVPHDLTGEVGYTGGSEEFAEAASFKSDISDGLYDGSTELSDPSETVLDAEADDNYELPDFETNSAAKTAVTAAINGAELALPFNRSEVPNGFVLKGDILYTLDGKSAASVSFSDDGQLLTICFNTEFDCSDIEIMGFKLGEPYDEDELAKSFADFSYAAGSSSDENKTNVLAVLTLFFS